MTKSVSFSRQDPPPHEAPGARDGDSRTRACVSLRRVEVNLNIQCRIYYGLTHDLMHLDMGFETLIEIWDVWDRI